MERFETEGAPNSRHPLSSELRSGTGATGGIGVVVVGSVNIDLVTRVAHLPGPGETVIGGAFHQGGGGKGANQAVAAARLGARTWLVGATGNDLFGELARTELTTAGVDLTYLSHSTEATGIAQILVGERGENLIAVSSGANSTVGASQVDEALRTILRPGWVVLANLEVPDEAVKAAAACARQLGARFLLNPAPARPLGDGLLQLCHVLTPNELEVDILCAAIRAPGQPAALLGAGIDNLVVTRGARGASLYRRGRPVYVQPAFAVDAVDTTGAGDAFNGALAWALASGFDVEESLRVAAAAGALSTREVGARNGPPTRSELMSFLAGQALATVEG